MSADERQIRELVAAWLEATATGDVDTVLGLMTDDVVFLVPGRPPMIGKSAFADAARAAGGERPRFDAKSDIREIRVLGDWACMWSHLTVTVTPPGGAEPFTRAGHTLTVLRKEGGRWLLARDANLLTAVPKPPEEANDARR